MTYQVVTHSGSTIEVIADYRSLKYAKRKARELSKGDRDPYDVYEGDWSNGKRVYRAVNGASVGTRPTGIFVRTLSAVRGGHDG